MGSYTGLASRAGKAITVTAYAAAVAFLSWATINNHLGDRLYGRLAMSIVSFPVSILDWVAGDDLFTALRGERHGADTSGWDYTALSWPGGVMTIILAISMMSSRAQRASWTAGWLLTAEVAVSGVATVIDQWVPRRSWGWPLVLCAAAMVAGLLLSRRAEP